MKKGIKKAILISLLTLFAIQAEAGKGRIKKADRFFSRYEYKRAAELYLKEAEKEKQGELQQKIYIKLADCYRKMNDYKEAEEWYNKAYTFGPVSDADFYLNYGLILKNNEKYDMAKVVFGNYLNLNPNDRKGELYLQSCDVALELKKFAQPFKVDNIASLNTPFADFSPAFYNDGIVFTSSRKSIGFDKYVYGWTGKYFLDLFYAKKDSGEMNFGKAESFWENVINKEYHDGPAVFSTDNNTIYFTRVLRDLPRTLKKTLGIHRIKMYSATMEKSGWKNFQPFFLNSDSFSVGHPFVTADGKKLYFISDMPGGFGGTDIYVCERENEKWGTPKNLGANVNTFAKEMFPYLDNDGNLYFSSEGYVGYGGLDICVAVKDENGNFQKAQPLKAPVNSSADDFGMLLAKDGKSGYFSSNRYGGVGDDDIYHFDLNDAKEEPNLVASLWTIGTEILSPKKAVPTIAKVNVDLKDIMSRQMLAEGIVWAYNVETHEVNEMPAKDGIVNFTAKIDAKIMVTGFSKGYNPRCATLNLGEKKDTVVNYTFELDKPSEMKLTFRNILYDFNKFNIRPDAAKGLDTISEILKTNKEATVELGSHTDSRGTDAYNLTLSQNRAKSAMQYLISKGIDKKRITAKGFGESMTLDDCTKQKDCPQDKQGDCACHQLNRRTEFNFRGLNQPEMPSGESVLQNIRNKFKDNKEMINCD